MHELSIAHDLISVIREHLIQYPGAQVSSITLLVGAYSGVDPEALRFVFPIAVEGTSLEGSNLVIKTPQPTYRCRDCGETSIDTDMFECPHCSSHNIKLGSGTELEISSVELLLPDEEPAEEAEKQRKCNG